VNLHEPIDRFVSQSPRTKTVAFLAFGAVIIAVLLFVFYLGVTKGDTWAESKYLKQRDENLIRATKAEAEQQRLKASTISSKSKTKISRPRSRRTIAGVSPSLTKGPVCVRSS